MKKYISILLIAVMVVFGLSACNNAKSDINLVEDKGDKIKIVTTIFPIYDWVRQIVGADNENIEITMLLDSGVDLHSYQPTTDDMLKISDCDLFIYVGGESDEWVDDALKESINKNMKVINLMDVLGNLVKTEEVVEGMQESEEEHEEDAGHEDEEEKDEHVWLSLKNAKILCDEIVGELVTIDSKNAKMYEQNESNYIEELDALDIEYQNVVDNAKNKTLLFGDRFPFRYLVDDYGLDYYAAFVGCSAESEASFETITFLAQKIDELGLNTVLTIEKSNGEIANTIIQNTEDKNQTVLAMDSMQSTTSADVENGTTYLSVMKSNLSVLKQALE